MERPGKDKRGSLEQWEAQLDTTPSGRYHTRYHTRWEIPYQVGGSVTWHLWSGTP